MYIERNAGGQIAAAFLDEQFRGQEWVPIDNRALQHFLAGVPRLPTDAAVSSMPLRWDSTTVDPR